MALKSIANGAAVIDFTDADRWMEMAKKYRMTMPGDSYQGFDVDFGFGIDTRENCIATNEERAKQKWGMGFGEVIKIAYAEVERHAKEKGWPKRSYYFLDEPRPEYRNVDSCRELIEFYVKNAPGTTFSGYYSPGAGRDPYFKLMPLSIAHHSEESLKTAVESGHLAWTYSAVGGHLFGAWLELARSKGLTGFTTGFYYPCSIPYYDFSDVEGAWGLCLPSKNGINPTVEWERLADRIDDYRYIKTLRMRAAAWKSAGDANAAMAAEAEKLLNDTSKLVSVEPHGTPAVDAAGWRAWRSGIVACIEKMSP